MAPSTRNKTRLITMANPGESSDSQGLSQAQVQELTSQIEARLTAQLEAQFEARIAALPFNLPHRPNAQFRDYVGDIERTLPNFSGEKSKFQEFKTKVLMKFSMLDRTGLDLDAVTKLDVVFNKLQDAAWNFANSKREEILADSNPDKVAVLLALLARQYDPVDKHFTAVLQLIRQKQDTQTVESFNDHFNVLLMDLPTSADELLKLIYLCQLNETFCGHARAQHYQTPKMSLAELQGLTSSYSTIILPDAATSPDAPRSAPRNAVPRRNGPPADAHAAKSGKKHEGELALSLGHFKDVDGWTPTATELRRPISEVPKLLAFLQANNLCTRCRCPGHWKNQCNGGNYVDPTTYTRRSP